MPRRSKVMWDGSELTCNKGDCEVCTTINCDLRKPETRTKENSNEIKVEP